jgi:predicted aconitase
VASGDIILDDEERAFLAGEHGPGTALAMRVVVGVAKVMRATRLIPITGSHVDSCVYYGDAGLDFGERLVELGARVRVPTTLNIGLVDLLHPELVQLDPTIAAAARRQMEAYVKVGGRPTFTCAPYQLADSRPGVGEQVAWAESNAIVFVNSVLGARTNRYGDFIDISAAITGRVPDAGLHRTPNRRGQVIFDVHGLSDALLASDVLYPILGLIVGAEAGQEIPVIDGLPAGTSEDRLKAIGAAAASSGAVALFHAVGSTPEAPTLAAALQDEQPTRHLIVDRDRLRAARDGLGSAGIGTSLVAVCVGTPHASVAEMKRILATLDGREVRIPLYVNTGRTILAVLEERGIARSLRDAGVVIVVDTCTYVTPIVREIRGLVMTSSAKWAYYAPGNIGVEVAFGGLEECVESAVRGEVWRDDDIWR